MQNTTNYNLNKPDGTDYAKIQALNQNADIIDAALKENKDAIENLDLSQITQSITEVDGRVTTHLDEKDKHNQFIHEGKLHQIGFGYNPTLGCMTFSIREVV